MSRVLPMLLATLLVGGAALASPAEAWKPDVTGIAVTPRPEGVPPTGHPGRNGPLDAGERQMAATAWRYFVNNTQAATGLANAVDGFPSTTLWDSASYLAGMISAMDLGLIDQALLDRRLAPFLATLEKLALFRDECPNKAYDTRSAAAVTYANQPGEIGCSAIDIGRLLIWLQVVRERFPAHAGAAEAIVRRWNFCELVRPGGELYGLVIGEGGAKRALQEGRLGYEEYGAKGFGLWGFDTGKASDPEPFDIIRMYGIDIAYDSRDPRLLGAHNYVVSESAVLDGIEMNWDLADDPGADDFHHTQGWAARFAQNIYRVQAERFARSGILTARSEHQLDGDPYFVYDTIFSDGYPWNTLTDDGHYVPKFAALAGKAAMGLWALWATPYTDRLLTAVEALEQPDKGILEGSYEDGRGPIRILTANNNGIILEALAYKQRGRLVPAGALGGAWWAEAVDAATRKARCLPARPAP